MERRKYVSGTQWCIWRWTDVASEYITRLHLIKTPWFAICLHWINKPDPEPFDHDHPVSFLSINLRGWYAERRNGEVKVHDFYNFVRASEGDVHTITSVHRDGALTLCFMGPKVREWGFHTPDGWVYWKDYYSAQAGHS